MTYHNYATYDAMLTGRNRDRRKLANNTYLERRGDDIAVRLHNTDVVVYRRSGLVQLYTGGWLTVTTKERINRFSPARVWSERGRWMVNGTHPFAEGITLHPDGSITGAAELGDVEAQDRRNRKMRRDIKRFVDSITPEMIQTAWENSGGDCFICRCGGTSCLPSHLDESYFHAHLALCAVKASGYHNPDVIMSMIYYDAVNRHSVDNMLTRALTKYLRANLLEGVATPGKKGQAA